jgi:putative transcriptional regulator
MSLCKLRFFTVLAAIVTFATVGSSHRQRKEFDVPRPNPLPHAHASLGYSGRPTKKLAGSRRTEPFHAEIETLPAVFLPVQSNNPKDLAAGRLLVASRDLADPNFAKTVVLLVHYDAQGAAGLILNRRTDVPLSRMLEDLNPAKERSDTVYLGGPVETPLVLALFQSPAKIDGAEQVFGGVYLISTKALFEKTILAKPDPGVFHVYVGYAGWTADQLRREVELGAWFIFPENASTVFNSDPDSLWSQMIGKTELQQAESEPAAQGPRTSVGQFSVVSYEQ